MKFGISILSIVPMRSEISDKSEMQNLDDFEIAEDEDESGFIMEQPSDSESESESSEEEIDLDEI